MGARVAFASACGVATLLVIGALASCGARTALVPEDNAEADAGPETGVFPSDRFIPGDVAAEDRVMPPIDAFKSDVPVINPCPDAAATLIYVIGTSTRIYSFDPAAGTFTPIGMIDCPGSAGSAPFSMAVDREGIAYAIFAQEPEENAVMGLYRISTKTGECAATSYNPVINGRTTFGMGFVANVGDGGDGGDAGETLFVAEDETVAMGVPGNGVLATLDTTTFALRNIGAFGPNPPGVIQAELTGTGSGRLFAFSPDTMPGERSFIAEIDPATAQVIGEDPLPGLIVFGGWAFGFWGGDFYTFTGVSDTGPGTVVSRFDPVTKVLTTVATLADDTIVGAGVSTCAPQN